MENIHGNMYNTQHKQQINSILLWQMASKTPLPPQFPLKMYKTREEEKII